MLRFARDLGRIGEAREADLKQAGFGEGEIVEIIAIVTRCGEQWHGGMN